MEDLIARFGLVVIFLGACVEGDLTLVLAGVAAHLELVHLWPAIATGAAGSLAGDLIWYALGRWRSDVIQRSRAYRVVGPAVERMAGRLGSWQIVAARVMYGTRVATMLFWGVYGLPVSRFVAVDLVGCLLWAGLLGSLGYGASSGAEALLGHVRRAQYWLLGAACTLVAALLIARYFVTRVRRRSAAASHRDA